MTMKSWSIRHPRYSFDLNEVYEDHPNMFSIELHHGGKITPFPSVEYLQGVVNYVDVVDITKICVQELDAMMLELGYVVPPIIKYYFLIPDESMDFGLRELANVEDFRKLGKYIAANKVIQVYTEHGNANMIEGGTENTHGIVETHGLQLPQDDDFDPFFGLHDFESNTTMENGNDKVNVEDGHEKINAEEVQPDGNDSDVIVDKDNEVDDVYVDMSDFRMNIHEDAEYAGFALNDEAQNEEQTDEGEDLEVINCDEWESLGEDSDTEKNRRVMLKQLGKEKVCSHGEVHKVSFYVGQMFKTKKDLKYKIDEHAIQTRKNLAFKKNDATRLRAYCRGKVPGSNPSGTDVDGGTKNTTGSSVGGGTSNPSGSKEVGGTDKESKGKNKASKGKDKTVKSKPCTWQLYASRESVDANWFIKTYNRKHICQNSRKIRACTATFLSKQIIKRVQSNPTIPVRALKEDLQETYTLGISIHKMFRAKATATKFVVGDYTKQYGLLRDYVLELQSTNPNTTVKIDVESEPVYSNPTRQFKRIYICLGSLKMGFKAGMRDLLGLDGAFMKGPFPGQVLTAVSLDSNNGIYPLAYALVEAENAASWRWFLECLGDDLDLGSNSNFTFVSDRQKGVINAVSELYPNAEHRYCLRHIHENMKKNWRGKEYKEYVWKCATATTVPEFQALMKEFGEYDKSAHDWLNQIPPRHWARSHFTGRAISDVLLNNMCEVLNSKLEKGRDKPILTCLEFIREYLMKRICNVVKEQRKCEGPLTPTATKLLKKNEEHASEYRARWNGGGKYQVAGPWNDQHVVDITNMTCTCRKWELTGIPCRHAIATWNDMTDNGEAVGELYTWVHKLYLLDTWKTAYAFKVEPVKGRVMWPKSDCPTTIIPPPHKTMPGRPKKKRRQTMEEKMTQKERANQMSNVIANQSQGSGQVEKLSRKFGTVKCKNCNQKGHNKRTCKSQRAGQGMGPSARQQEGGGS